MQATGAEVTGLSVGSHTLEFRPLVAPAAGCTVQPAVPVAAVRLQPPVVVTPAPVAMAPAAPALVAPAYKPHPGRGWKRGHW